MSTPVSKLKPILFDPDQVTAALACRGITDCLCCRRNDRIEVTQEPVLLPTWQDDTVRVDLAHPLVELRCTHCGHVMLFDALVMKLVVPRRWWAHVKVGVAAQQRAKASPTARRAS